MCDEIGMSWARLIGRIVIVTICCGIAAYIFITKLEGSSKKQSNTIGAEMQEDIDKQRGSEFERNVEKVLIGVIGWMPEKIFLAIVFGLFAAGIVELIWPIGPLVYGISKLIGGIFNFGIIGFVFGIIGAVIWSVIYAIIFFPMLIIDIIWCIVCSIIG